MTRRQSTLLIVAGAWSLYVWISFIVIQTRQHNSAAFKIVHGVLALISIGFGIAVGLVGWRARRAMTSAPSRTSEAEAEPVRT